MANDTTLEMTRRHFRNSTSMKRHLQPVGTKVTLCGWESWSHMPIQDGVKASRVTNCGNCFRAAVKLETAQ